MANIREIFHGERGSTTIDRLHGAVRQASHQIQSGNLTGVQVFNDKYRSLLKQI